MVRLVAILFTIHYSLFTTPARAQVGEYRTDFAVGVNGGYIMSNVAFVPKVPQGMLGGPTIGLTARLTSEKYFNSICAIVGELNYAQIGWKENILDFSDKPVPRYDDETQFLDYSRKINYVQIPVFARLGWGRERKGLQFFFQVGPQMGIFLSESTNTNLIPGIQPTEPRSSNIVAQETMPVEKKFDYGIVGGLGLEFSHPKVGHFLVEGRFYYGLGNIYGSSKRDYFARSNYNNIVIKFTYLFDIIRTRNSKIK